MAGIASIQCALSVSAADFDEDWIHLAGIFSLRKLEHSSKHSANAPPPPLLHGLPFHVRRKYKVEKWSDRNCSKSEETDSLRENAG